MEQDRKEWFTDWFNRDYLNLYAHRDGNEARFQAGFLIDHVKLKKGEAVLDLACGSGRHAFALARRGFRVTGIDLSSELIGEAQRALEKESSLPLEFKQIDMRQQEGLGVFDAVISMFTSFGYFRTYQENEQIFRQVRERLLEGGKYFLDYLHPCHVRHTLTPKETLHIRGETVQIEKKIIEGRAVKTIQFPNRTYEESVALYSREEIEKMLRAAKLEPVEVWNDYDGSPWRPDGERQLFYCIAKA